MTARFISSLLQGMAIGAFWVIGIAGTLLTLVSTGVLVSSRDVPLEWTLGLLVQMLFGIIVSWCIAALYAGAALACGQVIEYTRKRLDNGYCARPRRKRPAAAMAAVRQG